MELHIVVGKDGFIREQDGRQSFESVVADIISGQYEDADIILNLMTPDANWPYQQVIEDISCKVAWAIRSQCDGDRQYLIEESPAHILVARHVSIADAWACLEHS